MAVPGKKKNIEDISFISFKKKLQKYLNSYQIKKIEKAFDLAKDAHHGQKRQSGENYITHPLDAASYLAEYELDHETIMAAILHDVVEDDDRDHEADRGAHEDDHDHDQHRGYRR